MGVHRGSPLMVEFHAANRTEPQAAPLRDVDEVVAAFQDAGFDASVTRLAIRYVPATTQVLDWLTYYNEDKLLLRFES